MLSALTQADQSPSLQWGMAILPQLGRLRLENLECKATLSNVVLHQIHQMSDTSTSFLGCCCCHSSKCLIYCDILPSVIAASLLIDKIVLPKAFLILSQPVNKKSEVQSIGRRKASYRDKRDNVCGLGELGLEKGLKRNVDVYEPGNHWSRDV